MIRRRNKRDPGAPGGARPEGPHPELNPLEQAFLDASIALETSEREAARRRTRNARLLAAVLAVLLVAALIGGVVALQQRQDAVQQRQLAISRQLAAEADSLLGSQPDTAALMAVEAFHLAPTTEARTSLLNVSQRKAYAVVLPGSEVPASEGGYSVAFSPDGRAFASANLDKTIKVWDVDHDILVATLTGQGPINHMTFSPNGQILALATGAQNPYNDLYGSNTESNYHAESVTLWNVARRVPVVTMTDLPGHVTGMDFDPHGNTLVVSTGQVTVDGFGPNDAPGNVIDIGGAIELWDVTRGALIARLPGIEAAKHPGWRDPLAEAAFSGDGRLFAAVNHYNKTITVWNAARRVPVATLAPKLKEGEAVYGLGFTPGGQLIALSANVANLDARGSTTTVWDVARRTPVSAFNEDQTTLALAVSPDGRIFTSVSESGLVGSVDFWDMNSHRSTMRLSGPQYANIPFGQPLSGDGSMLALEQTGDANSGPAAPGPGPSPTPTAQQNEAIVLWDLEAGRVAARICQKLGRSLSRQEWRQYVSSLPYQKTCGSGSHGSK